MGQKNKEENLNLVKILKDCPEDTKLYSPVYGEVELIKVREGWDYPIEVKLSNNTIDNFTEDGRIFIEHNGECMLFPSKNQRDWSKFKVKQSERKEWCESQEITKWTYISDPLPKQSKFDPRTLNPFDKVLARDESYTTWCADFVTEPSHFKNETPLTLGIKEANMVIPYNEETKHLAGTNEEAPTFYIYWERD